MNCVCHDEPAYWTRDDRYRAGGFWRCAVKKLERARRRYDTDQIHRIGVQLRTARDSRRRATIGRRKGALV